MYGLRALHRVTRVCRWRSRLTRCCQAAAEHPWSCATPATAMGKKPQRLRLAYEIGRPGSARAPRRPHARLPYVGVPCSRSAQTSAYGGPGNTAWLRRRSHQQRSQRSPTAPTACAGRFSPKRGRTRAKTSTSRLWPQRVQRVSNVHCAACLQLGAPSLCGSALRAASTCKASCIAFCS